MSCASNAYGLKSKVLDKIQFINSILEETKTFLKN
jgi:hypothetical protein